MSDRYLGMEVIEDPSLTKAVEDWSRVRSPGRAARRRHPEAENSHGTQGSVKL